MNYLWSAKNSAFILDVMKSEYEKNGWDFSDARQIEDDIITEFMGEQPAGKIRATGADGLPCWLDTSCHNGY
ncbi:phage tail protein [Yersinia kristensenii]|uniref:phage tail protein n=1 Tax=Yersinia kristensenii TaxID=28152 RepID=UPI001C608806|nr:phage tail protein [Yersinia kristensenii]MBW5826014.1 phage tail protein [Yersinia kristensenii]